VPNLAVDPTSDRFAVGNAGKFLVGRMSEPSSPLLSINNPRRITVTALAFHPSGRYLAAASNDETIKLYDTHTWGLVNTFTWQIGRMRSVAFSPDGTLAAAGSDTGRVVVWDFDG
jgi:WD40 repeat protein